MSEDSELMEVFDGDLPHFEQNGRQNGHMTWSARSLASYLGYKDYNIFKAKVLNRAQQTLISLDILVEDHFKQETTVDEDGKKTIDLRLSRCACYLAAMNGDPKKKGVAQAQAYFARFSEECQRYLDDAEQIERVLIRDELSEHEKTLSITAKGAGVKEFALFRNAGYRGLYNMNLSDLRKLKSIPENRSPLDFMGKDELAANLFRTTQTDAKIKREHIRGQKRLEAAAEKVGATVRETMAKISGQRPEDLLAQEDIKKVRKELRSSGKILKNTSAPELFPVHELEQGTYLEAPEERED
jgi:DNA-damage-inducible protein D